MHDSWKLSDISLEYESELIRYSYNKIWSELSARDREIVIALTECGGSASKQEIMEKTGLSSAMVNRYRGRLKEQGIIQNDSIGVYTLALPMFDRFVQEYVIG